MAFLVSWKCVQKGDRVTPLDGQLLKYILCFFVILGAYSHSFPNSWMKSLACMSQAPPVSMATGTKMFVTAMLEYFKVLSDAAWFVAAPANIEVSPTWERMKVSATVTSRASAISLAHGMSVAPPGLLPSARERPTGSLTAGICALLTVLHMMLLLLF